MGRKLFKYTVRGRGDFPFDMLRYDHCWPAEETRNGSLGLAHGPGDFVHERDIHLVGLDSPTGARWRSFGWTVLPGLEWL